MRARRREAAWNGPWDVFLNCLKARGVNKSILRLSKHVIKSVRSFVELVWQELLSWSQFQFFVSEWRWCVSRDVIYSLMVPYKYITHSLNVYTRTRVAPLTNSLCWMSFVIKPNQRLFLDVLYSSLRTSSSTAEDNPTCQILVTQSKNSTHTQHRCKHACTMGYLHDDVTVTTIVFSIFSLVKNHSCVTHLHYKDCNKMHSGSCSQIMPSFQCAIHQLHYKSHSFRRGEGREGRGK